MKRRASSSDKILRQFIGRHGNPSEELVNAEIDKAWKSIQAAGSPVHEDRAGSFNPSGSSGGFWRRRGMVLACSFAAALVLAVIVVERAPLPDESWAAARGDQRIPFGQVVHSGTEPAQLKLTDGSHVEMRSGSELALENANDGVRIRLNGGNIIVTAAGQKSGHLYVQTKDLTVSVVGTLFMVNAEEEGSRVAVIEGEVQVLQGQTLKKLWPGDQVATGESMQALPVAAKISWSSSAPGYLALLQQNTATRPAPPVELDFAATSIKPQDSTSMQDSGFGCRGVDGKRVAPFGEMGEPEFVIPMGRCAGTAVVASLVDFAYNVPHRYGPKVPDWAVTGTPTQLQIPSPDGSVRAINAFVKAIFQINAVADNPSSTTSAQLRQMVQTMLTKRFKLESHRETQEVSGYVLSVGNAPLKLKEVSGDPTPLNVDFSNPGRPTVRGRSTIDQFASLVMGFTNPVGYVDKGVPAYVANRTGLTGIYEWEFVLPIPGGSDRRGGGPAGANATPNPPSGPRSVAQRFAWRGPAMAEAVEDQLGLRMQLQKLPVEVLVIDRIEMPSSN
jgi:uncharacterized protein (TIGR03435 family)